VAVVGDLPLHRDVTEHFVAQVQSDRIHACKSMCSHQSS
jgi:hypothetical protein